jgi:FtsP/CotA-like multicopper oxidase with cupredoxin domain
MSLPSIGRRAFVADAAGGLLLCTLAGKQFALDKPADVEKLASDIPVPPKVAAARANGGSAPQAQTVLAKAASTNEYWIQAEKVKWDIVPKGRDQMMGKQVKGKTTFKAYAYRAYSPDFAAPLGPATIPGPLIEANVGETITVHFRNKMKTPVTIHPHGVMYSADMDGAYKGKYTDPGGFVQKGDEVTYIWEAIPSTVGAWMYHDHGPMDPLPLYKGLLGPIIIRDPNKPQPDKEFFTAFHSFQPAATGLDQPFYCINGRAYAGNTPTFRSNVGDDVAFHVYALDDAFHTFHVHGHRWPDETGKTIDNVTIGPGDITTARFTEDNPGRWFYHCHVFSHLHQGMNGWYLVE